MRYSYVEPDGETYDISDIVEEEWQEKDAITKNDLLQGVLVRSKEGLGDNFDRVLNKIKDGRASGRVPTSQSKPIRSISPSGYSNKQDGMSHLDKPSSRSSTPLSTGLARSPTPMSGTTGSMQRVATPSSGTATSVDQDLLNSRPRANTPPISKAPARRNPSIASVMSDMSGYVTPASHMHNAETPDGSTRSVATPKPQRKQPYIPKDDFGLSHMMTIIELGDSINSVPISPMDSVDELLFGRELDIESLNPRVKDIFSDSFKQLKVVDKVSFELVRLLPVLIPSTQTLDEFLQRVICAS